MLPRGQCSNAEGFLRERARRSHVRRRLALWASVIIMGCGRGLTVSVMTRMRQRGRDVHMGLRQMRRGHTEAV